MDAGSNIYQIPSHISQSTPFSPGQGSSRGLVWPPFPAGVRGVQPTSQPYLPVSSSMLYTHALGPVAYTLSPLVPSLPSLPHQVPPPLPPSSLLGAPHARVMNHSGILLPSHINQFSYNASSRPSLLDSMRNTGLSLLNTDSDVYMEDDMTHINEEQQVIHENLHAPQMQVHPTPERVFVHVGEPADNSPPLSSYTSNPVGGEQSSHVHMHSDRNSAAPAVEISAFKADERNKNRTSKYLENFKAAVTKFVKKVLKPFWRRCVVTRVVFKTIVRKAVNKVLGSMKPHHIPSSKVKINRYIELSRSKLTALVMGYVDKYVRV